MILVFLRKANLSHIPGVGNRILQLSFHCIFSIAEHSANTRSLYAGHLELQLWCCIDPKAQIPTLLWGLLCLLRKEGQSLRQGVSRDVVTQGARPFLCPDRSLLT